MPVPEKELIAADVLSLDTDTHTGEPFHTHIGEPFHAHTGASFYAHTGGPFHAYTCNPVCPVHRKVEFAAAWMRNSF